MINDLRNSGGILLQFSGNVVLGINSDRVGTANNIPVGAIDANFGSSINDTVYAGSVAIQSSSSASFYTVGTNSVGVDIIAENLRVEGLTEFGSANPPYPNPIRLRVNDQFTIFNRGLVSYPYGRPIAINDINRLLQEFILFDPSSFKQLVDIETLGEVDPAIFTEVRNYNYDDIAILMPDDQLFTEDEEDEYQQEKQAQ